MVANVDILMNSLGYKPLERLDGSCQVYKVCDSSENNFVLKMPLNLKDRWYSHHILRDARAGSIGRGLDCVPKVVSYLDQADGNLPYPYSCRKRGNNRMVILVKEFVDGVDVSNSLGIQDSELQNALYSDVRELHSRGVAGFELLSKWGVPKNIVIGDRPYLIDLGDVVFESEGEIFEQRVEEDLRNLDFIFGMH